MSKNLNLYSRYLIIFFALLSFSCFNGFSQTISIGSPNNATEGAGPPVSFLISLDNGAINTTGSDITGTITLSGTATPGVDYLAPMSFTIANGANSIGLLVPIVDDALVECDEIIIASISNPNVGSINPGAASSSATIFDDECATQYVVSIGSPVDAIEGTSDISFEVFIEGGFLNTTGSPISGMIAYSGTANPTIDYNPIGSFSIPVGANSTTITLAVNDDTALELTESVEATLTGAPNVGSYGNTLSTANIFDDEAATLTLSIGSPVDGAEGGSAISYIISLNNGVVNATGGSITGLISYTGMAIDGADYAGVTTFSIPDGASSTLIALFILDDLLIECNETVIATISNPTIGSINPNGSSSTAIIVDDECTQLVISIGSPVDGAEAFSPTNASFDVFIEGGAVNGTGFAITGSINFGGAATALTDYSAPFSFSIPNGANSTTLTLPVVDDLLLECDEDVIATISSPSIGTIGTASSTAIIVDDECNSTTISIVNPMDGEEGGSDASFVITLDNGVINGTGGAIMGDIAYSGTATAGSDYQDVIGWSIPNGASFGVLSLPVIDDTDDECDETIEATISNPSFATINIATDSAIIVDNDCTVSLDVISNNDFKIHPNPVVSQVNFESESQMSRYAIIDLKGRVLSEGEINAKELSLNVDFLSAGTYILNVVLEDGSILNSKILKE